MIRWRKACSGGGSCIEVADTGPHVLIRDSKQADSPVLHVPAPGFRALVEWCKAAG